VQYAEMAQSVRNNSFVLCPMFIALYFAGQERNMLPAPFQLLLSRRNTMLTCCSGLRPGPAEQVPDRCIMSNHHPFSRAMRFEKLSTPHPQDASDQEPVNRMTRWLNEVFYHPQLSAVGDFPSLLQVEKMKIHSTKRTMLRRFSREVRIRRLTSTNLGFCHLLYCRAIETIFCCDRLLRLILEIPSFKYETLLSSP
jgi:hypothetical protein